MSDRLLTIAALAAATVLAPTVAQAHGGLNVAGFWSGLSHPFGGADHVLAMLGIGLWAGRRGGRWTAALPAVFLAAMAAGALFAGGLPLVELGIAGSVLVVGLVLALDLSPSLGAAVALAALFAVFHGAGHAAGIPLTAAPAAYGLGFIAATAALLFSGVALATVFVRASQWRIAGSALLASGMVLALQA